MGDLRRAVRGARGGHRLRLANRRVCARALGGENHRDAPAVRDYGDDLASLREPHWTYWRDIVSNLTIPLGMMAGCVLMVRFDLRAAEHTIRDGFALAESVNASPRAQKPC